VGLEASGKLRKGKTRVKQKAVHVVEHLRFHVTVRPWGGGDFFGELSRLGFEEFPDLGFCLEGGGETFPVLHVARREGFVAPEINMGRADQFGGVGRAFDFVLERDEGAVLPEPLAIKMRGRHGRMGSKGDQASALLDVVVAGELVDNLSLQTPRWSGKPDFIVEGIGQDKRRSAIAAVPSKERHEEVGGGVQGPAIGQEGKPWGISRRHVSALEHGENPALYGGIRTGHGPRQGSRFGRGKTEQVSLRDDLQGDVKVAQIPTRVAGGLFEMCDGAEVGLRGGNEQRHPAWRGQTEFKGRRIHGRVMEHDWRSGAGNGGQSLQ